MKKLFLIFLAALASAQQPQTKLTGSEAIQGANAKWVQGVGPGYRPTKGSGLTLNLTAGTSFCSGTIVTYAGGTLTMTNTTNYVYLDTSSSCAPAVKTSAFTASDIPVAVVVASGSVITAITDDRTWFATPTAAYSLPAQYTKLRCEAGLGDGLNAIAAGTYLQFTCVNTSGVTWTITGINCWTDNAGSSTLDAKNNAGTDLLTGAVTCNSTTSGGGAAGTQSSTVTLANNDAFSFTFVADGTSKQTNWTVSMTQ